MREAHVVADAQAQLAPGGLGHRRPFARRIERRLPMPLASGQVDVEHVDLVVGRLHRAVRSYQRRAVGQLAVLAPHQGGADQDPNPELAGQGAQAGHAGIFVEGPDRLEQLGLVALQDVGGFGRGDQLGPAAGGLPHQRPHLRQGGGLGGRGA